MAVLMELSLRISFFGVRCTALALPQCRTLFILFFSLIVLFFIPFKANLS